MKQIKLTDICNPRQWKTIPTNELLDEGFPVYGANGIIGYYNEFNHEKPVVAITCRGASCGSINITLPKSYVTGNAMCLDDVRSDIKLKYLYYCLVHYDFSKVISGSAQPQITRQGLEKVILSIGNPKEQQEIVDILDKLSRIIKNREMELEQLNELMKARFIEMFGDLKINSQGWEIKSFDELSYLITDGEHATPRRTTEGIFLLSARNILNHSLQLDDVDYIDQEEYDRIAKRVVPQEGDVLISCSGTVGRCCSVPPDIRFQMVRSAALIRFKEEINPVFAEYMIASDYLQEQINSSKTASSQANLFQGKIKALKGFVPPIELQQRFATFVSQVNKSKAAVQQSLDETQVLFDSLMQKYFG